MYDNAKVNEVVSLQKSISRKRYVKQTEYITRDRAAEELQKDLGEDFVDFLGYNPLSSVIEVRIKAKYANPQNLEKIEKDFSSNRIVKEVVYQKSLLNLVNENVEKISLIILGFSSLLLFISIVLINNTIRLAVYSKRFIIKSMLLIGATQNFIRKPFIINGILEGIYSSLLSIIMLIGAFFIAMQQIPELGSITDRNLFLYLFGIIMFLGVILSGLSNWWAVTRYLRLKTDFLYLQ
jgi:cell division transport system permease protein